MHLNVAMKSHTLKVVFFPRESTSNYTNSVSIFIKLHWYVLNAIRSVQGFLQSVFISRRRICKRCIIWCHLVKICSSISPSITLTTSVWISGRARALVMLIICDFILFYFIYYYFFYIWTLQFHWLGLKSSSIYPQRQQDICRLKHNSTGCCFFTCAWYE